VQPVGEAMDRSAIRGWLIESEERALETLWARADATRRAWMGEAVHLRGLVEIGNYCVRGCAYCGISTASVPIRRYRMTADEIVACAERARRFGYGTVVLQAGEDPGLTREMIAGVVRRIKARTGLAVTLGLGEREDADLLAWKAAGADRYLLRFETSDAALHRRLHPPQAAGLGNRLERLARLRDIGYEVGSGVMVGIPGQTWDTLARDIELFRDLDLDMVGVGPYLPGPRTPLAGALRDQLMAPPDDQVANDVLTTLKVVALARLVCPSANIPSTTALATLDRGTGRELGLARGANVVMPNLTPSAYRVLYDIYPGKAFVETAELFHASLAALVGRMGRTMGTGPGGRSRDRRTPGTSGKPAA
jgi:biotin synthase